jgi:hypothetical protein
MKSGGKKPGSRKSALKPTLSAAAKAGDATAAVLAVSKNATAQESKEIAILDCLKVCFQTNGLPPVSPSSKIDWQTIPNNIITIIGNCVRDCINGKGFKSPGWAGPFRNLKNQGKVSIVANLVKGMTAVVKP